jgi:hypothetical protein
VPADARQTSWAAITSFAESLQPIIDGDGQNEKDALNGRP